VFNGIWELPYRFQLSGLYFYADNGYATTTAGVDSRATGGAGTRLRPDGTIIPRNNFKRDPLHRVDVRGQRRFQLGRIAVDGMIEVFNLFNHANLGSYTLNERNPSFGRPTQNTAAAFQPRIVQLGFRVAF
jgi:hypothetical protein